MKFSMQPPEINARSCCAWSAHPPFSQAFLQKTNLQMMNQKQVSAQFRTHFQPIGHPKVTTAIRLVWLSKRHVWRVQCAVPHPLPSPLIWQLVDWTRTASFFINSVFCPSFVLLLVHSESNRRAHIIAILVGRLDRLSGFTINCNDSLPGASCRNVGPSCARVRRTAGTDRRCLG